MKILFALLMAWIPLNCHAQTDLYKIGKPFGRNQAWQLGLDTSLMPAGGCVQRELHDGQWLAGPCRDILVLAKQEASVFHVGAYAMANTERSNWSYGPRIGVNIGQVAKIGIAGAARQLPYLESLVDMHVPKFVSYIDKALTLDYGAGYRPLHDASVNGEWTHGPVFKLDIPFDDIVGLLKSGL